ncbi:MAG TPA: lamin tail domain-containing protein, partial [Verrucomicrobiae bacterium]
MNVTERRPLAILRILCAIVLVAFCLPSSAQVFLNEICADNGGSVVSPGHTSPDYIELYNTNSAAVSLSSWTLTDDPTTPAKYKFPSGTSIPAKGFLIVWLDSSITYTGLICTNFTLKNSGEEVALYNGSTRKDYVVFGPQIRDLPLCRLPNGTGAWTLGKPTPLATNQAVVAGTFGTNIALRINEWLATNSAGANMDWLEIYNPKTNGIVALGGLYISDMTNAITTPALRPNSFIGSGAFLQYWCDSTTNLPDHLLFKLSHTLGETITIYQTNKTSIIDRVTFGPQTGDVSMGRLPDGGTNFFYFPGKSNLTPGAANAWQAITNILLNEILTHTDPPIEDAVELYNPTDTAVDISNWWMSNDADFPFKFHIPAGTVVPAHGYKMFFEQNQLNGASTTPGFNRSGTGNLPDFTFNSAHGDSVLLTSVLPNGTVTGARIKKDFGSAAHGVSFGRYVKSDGGTDLVAMKSRTFGHDNPIDISDFRLSTGMDNSPPLIGPMIITEILYNPPDVISGGLTNDN